ncbi:RNA-directed DNA polymerase, eukaryota, reverse transcriptase zinc-binding domain protein, partial [Tanacetum coccineum]
MLDPDPQNPNPDQIPPRGSDNVIRTKHSTRSQSKDSSIMNKQSKGVSNLAHVSFKKGSMKNSGKKGMVAKGMEGLEYDDEDSEARELKEGGYDGDKGSVAYSDTQSLDSRSVGESISKREVQAALERDVVSDIANEFDKMIINDIFVSGKDGISVDNIGPMPVPVEENPILNPRSNTVSSPRILKRGKALTNGGSRANAEFSFNQVEKWPSLSGRDNVSDMGMSSGKVNGVVGGNSDGIDIVEGDTKMGDSSGIKKPNFFISDVQGISQSCNNNLTEFPISINDKGKFVAELDPVLEKGCKNWGMTLVGYFIGLKMSYREIVRHLRRMWRSYQFDEEAGLCMVKPKPAKVPLWVRIMNVSLEAWNSKGISRIASGVGTPIIMDRITTFMCDKAYGRASFAKVLVEVDAARGLVDSVEANYKSLGKLMELKVEYPWKPPLCSHCKLFGHSLDICSKKVLTEVDKAKKAKVVGQRKESDMGNSNGRNDWQIMNNRKSIINGNASYGFNRQRNNFRGGYGGRGRGGLNGRGFGDQRYFRNDNIQQRIDLACEKGVHISIEEKNSWDEELRNYFIMKMQEVIKRENVDDLKAKISNLGKQIGHSNKMIAIETRDRANNMVKSVMVEKGLSKNQAYQKIYDEVYRDELDRIKVLDMRKQCAEVELFFKTGQVFTVYELETWTDEKLEFYKASIGEKAYDKCVEMIRMDTNEGINNEVVEDLDAGWSWVSNSVDSSKGCRIAVGWDTHVMSAQLLFQTNQIMHFMIRCFKDNRQMYVSIVYGENSPKARLKLWKDLLEINDIAGKSSWVMLGDFNVVLKINENTNGMNVRGEGIREFVECVKSLEMEDINMCGIFANFMPYLSSDHYHVVLCMPDVTVQKPKSFRFMNYLAEKTGFKEIVNDNWYINVEGYAMFKLVKMLKAMKKHLRSFNKQNGNVFEKVKFHQTEQARVQESLDKGPFNSFLREEEMVYVHAYREAAIDEERLLKQNTKIEWLKEGDSNSSYFHNVIKGRVSRSRIEDVFEIEDAGSQFIKKLDVDSSVDLIKPITNEEIKEALFSIDDNKASGPDGYTSKFFKASWNVVVQDVCCTVKEFFMTGKMLGELNATLISLTPKVSVPSKVTDYRPISCCNIVYKTISKVITNRLKPVLSDLVDANQSAFIPGRLISDNILLAQEFMKGFNWDIGEFGIHPVMVNWIMICLTSVSFSICVNGETHGFFRAKRRLRQVCDDIDSLLCNFLWSNKDGIGSMIGNGKPCSVWFDKWNSSGPLSKLIDHRMIYIAGLDINAKVIDLIKNNAWCWPIDWGNEYDSMLDVLVPNLNSDLEDKPVWINKKGKEKCLMLLRFGRLLKSSILKLFGIDISDLLSVYQDMPLSLGLKLMGLKLKSSSDVMKASKVWKLPMKKDNDSRETYRIP